jgi:excisionase family DNA binding protein
VSRRISKGNRAMAEKNIVEFTRGRFQSSTHESDGPAFEPGRRKQPARVTVAHEDKILVSREEAAQLLSISQRGLDYLVAAKRLPTRRIGGRVLIPVADLRRYARCDHPERIVS